MEVHLSDEGSTVADMLSYVKLDATALLRQFTAQVSEAALDDKEARLLVDTFKEGLYGYTYLED